MGLLVTARFGEVIHVGDEVTVQVVKRKSDRSVQLHIVSDPEKYRVWRDESHRLSKPAQAELDSGGKDASG